MASSEEQCEFGSVVGAAEMILSFYGAYSVL